MAGGFDDLRFGKAMGRGSLGMTAMKETWADAAGAAAGRERDYFIEAVRAEAKRRLAGHKSPLESLTKEEMRALAEMDEPAVLCGRVDR